VRAPRAGDALWCAAILTMVASCGSQMTPAPHGAPPEITSFFSGQPDCKSAADTGAHVTLFWTSRHATEAWIASYPNAGSAGDPKTTPGALGPLPPNASLRVPYRCADAANPNEYSLAGYGPGGSRRKDILIRRNL
jgi:hypothetical protein